MQILISHTTEEAEQPWDDKAYQDLNEETNEKELL